MKSKTIKLEMDLNKSKDLNAFIEQNIDSFNITDFHGYLLELQEKSGKNVKTIIDQTYINPTYCYQIFRGIRMPNRDRIIQLSFALALSIDELNRLLKLSGRNPLYVKDLRDAIVIYSIKNGKTLDQLEQILLDKKLETISEL